MQRAIRIIPFFFGFLFLVGAGVRIAGGKALLSADMVYRSAGEVAFPGVKTPEAAAVSFYMFIDRGMYEEAYDICIEPDFYSGSGPALFKERVDPHYADFQGLTGKEEFLNRMNFELGRSGSWIRLHNVRAERVEDDCSVPDWLENYAASESCLYVRVTGHILGACTIFSWEKTVPVVETGDGNKVLLPGTKQERQFYYQEWIMNIEKIFDLRAVDSPAGAAR